MKFLLALLYMLQLSVINGQSIDRYLLSNGGGNMQGENINIHWSAGEIAVATNQNGIKISEGFHQGKSIITSVIDMGSKLNIIVYPNPTTDIISVQNNSETRVTAYISNSNGALIQQLEISNEQQQIDLTSFLAGTYIITFKNLENHTKSYKLVKI